MLLRPRRTTPTPTFPTPFRPNHFYDEQRIMLDRTYGAGTKIRFQAQRARTPRGTSST